MNGKTKSITLSRKSVSEVDGEHRVTFVASSATLDRDEEIVEIGTFCLPVKGGGVIRVSEIPADGADNVDIPLLTDHDVYEVDKTIGSVRKAYYQNGELIFEAGISSRPYAQEIFTLIEEKHLDNAFSISFGGYEWDPQTSTMSNGEVYEVSVVTRGSNKYARVLSAKSLDQTPVERCVDEVKEKDRTVNEDEIQKTEVETVEQVENPVEKSVENSTDTALEDSQMEDATEAVDEEASSEEETNEEKEKEMDEKIVKSIVKQPSQVVTSAKSAGYLKTKGAMKDFGDLIAKMKGQDSATILKAWEAELKEKSIDFTNGELLPSRLEQIFFKTWYDQTGALGTFRNINSNAAALYAFTGEGEGIRAKGHRKGDLKANQDIATLRRDLKAKIIYKKLPIDLQDLLDDQTGELTAFRAEELAGRVANEIVRGAILSDGRSAPAEGAADYRVFDGTRGLFSIKADLDAAANATANPYAAAVAVRVDNVASDNLYDKIRKTAGAVRDEYRRGKVVVVETGSLTDLELIKDSDGRYVFQPGTNMEALLGYTIIELDGVSESGYDVIAYTREQYALYGSNEMVRTWFDGNYNQDNMLVERSVAGSLFGSRAAAGYVSATNGD